MYENKDVLKYLNVFICINLQILSHIFRNLEVKNLRSCSQVNLIWRGSFSDLGKERSRKFDDGN